MTGKAIAISFYSFGIFQTLGSRNYLKAIKKLLETLA